MDALSQIVGQAPILVGLIAIVGTILLVSAIIGLLISLFDLASKIKRPPKI